MYRKKKLKTNRASPDVAGHNQQWTREICRPGGILGSEDPKGTSPRLDRLLPSRKLQSTDGMRRSVEMVELPSPLLP